MEFLANQRVSFDDYQKWTDERRYEIIDGRPYLMSPAPSLRHQQVLVALTAQVYAQLRGHRCQALVAPTDVKLSQWDVVQPDLVVVCNPEQLAPTHVEGPPSLVVEVLSPSTARQDRMRKLNLYAASGVAEYWIVSPDEGLIEILVLDGPGYRLAAVHTHVGRIVSPTIPAIDLDLTQIFAGIDLPPLDALMEGSIAYHASP